MFLSEAVLLAAEIILVLITLITFFDYFRYRDRPRLDIAIMFATLGLPAFLLVIDELFSLEIDPIGLAIFVLFLAHPYSMLRLARHFRPLPAWAARFAAGALVFSLLSYAILFFLMYQAAPNGALVLVFLAFILISFIPVEAYAALSFARGVFEGAGLVRHRLQFLAAGSTFLIAISLLLALLVALTVVTASVADSLISTLFAILGVLVAVSYFLGLAPPLRLRRYWQMMELQSFLDQMNRLPFDQTTQQLLDMLSRAAVGAVGGSAGTAAFYQPESRDFLLHPPAEYPALEGLRIPDGGQIGRSWHEQAPLLIQSAFNFGPGDHQAAAQVEAAAFAAIPIQVLDKPFCLLLVFLPHSPLFPGDDLALLKQFAGRVSLALAFVPLLEQERKLVTELKEKTAELQQAHDTLEQRVQERTAELAAVNEELQQFTYIVSHDLRSPLVNLKGFVTELGMSLRLITRFHDKLLPHLEQRERETLQSIMQEDIPEAMDFINTAAAKMDSLVSALLDLSRLGRRPLELNTVDMNRLVSDTLKTLAHVIEEKGVTVEVEPLPDAYSDLLSIEQIMSNLLTNAVNYLDPKRPGFVKISATENGETLTYHIQDNGQGIAPADQHNVFVPFRRAGKQEVPGEGMGLAYVQTLVRRHNGRITFESEPGVGTTFNLTIPKHNNGQ